MRKNFINKSNYSKSMANDDYGAINVISDDEREILGIGGPKKPEEEEKLFETIGNADD